VKTASVVATASIEKMWTAQHILNTTIYHNHRRRYTSVKLDSVPTHTLPHLLNTLLAKKEQQQTTDKQTTACNGKGAAQQFESADGAERKEGEEAAAAAERVSLRRCVVRLSVRSFVQCAAIFAGSQRKYSLTECFAGSQHLSFLYFAGFQQLVFSLSHSRTLPIFVTHE